jgi:1-acyl-sn-glycerol-3-phosphate acyltransferase
MDIWYAIAKSVLKAYLGVCSQGCEVSGKLPLPPGAKIIAANHPNASDGFHIPFILEDKLSFLIQGNLFALPVIGLLLNQAGQIPVHPRHGITSLQMAYDALARGRTVVIFPEGRLNPQNQPVQAGTGAIRLSLSAGAPIVPLGIYVPSDHTFLLEYHAGGQFHQGRWQTRGKCHICIGTPWMPSQEVNSRINAQGVHELTRCLMDKIFMLAQQACQDSTRQDRASVLENRAF